MPASPVAGRVLTATSPTAATWQAPPAPGADGAPGTPGAVLQIVQAVKTAAEYVGAYSDGTYNPIYWYNIAGLSLSVNLASSSSRVRVQALVHCSGPYQSKFLALRLVRTVDGEDSAIGVGAAVYPDAPVGAASFIGGAGGNLLLPVVLDWIDSPGAAGPCSYRVQIYSLGSGGSGGSYIESPAGAWINRKFTGDDYYTRVVSTLTLSEIV